MRTFLEIISFLVAPAVPVITLLTIAKSKPEKERRKIMWIAWGIGVGIGVLATISILTK